MSQLIHCIYASQASAPFSSSQLMGLLQSARSANEAIGVTGMLLHTAGSFFQVLEGEPSCVNRLFEHIGRDPRHRQVVRIIQEPIARRKFPDWTMGFVELDARQLASIAGANDFFADGAQLRQLQAGRARKLLEAFAQGRWRSATTMGQNAAAL